MAQILLLLLLGLSAVLVAWWLMDQTAFLAFLHEQTSGLYAAEARAASVLLARGESASSVESLFSHVEVIDGEAQVRRSDLDQLDARRRRHLNQYFWEGGFFLVVLVAGMGVLWRALSQETLLRQRQENFLASVSHELKTPIASLRLTAETIAMREPAPERRKELMSRILEDLERLETMVSNLLETSRLDDGRVELQREAVLLGAVLEQVRREMRVLVDGTEVEVKVPEDLEVYTDPRAVAAVLRNLLGNALKATAHREGGRVTVEAEDGGSYVRLRVRDNGVGFPPAEAERLFEKFYRPGDEMQRRSPGTGLGLYIVERLVALDGGSVAAYSEGPGQGAIFTVVWPSEA